MVRLRNVGLSRAYLGSLSAGWAWVQWVLFQLSLVLDDATEKSEIDGIMEHVVEWSYKHKVKLYKVVLAVKSLVSPAVCWSTPGLP